MKCTHCNGTGKRFVPTNKNAITGNGYTADCLFCNGTGEIEVTNEEWFDTLSTEEKAKAIVCLAHNASALAIKYHCADSDVDAIETWLKQPHKEKHE